MRTANTQENRGFNLASKFTGQENPYIDYNGLDPNPQKRLTFDSIVLTTLLGLAIIVGVGVVSAIFAINNPAIAFPLAILSSFALIGLWAFVFFKKTIKNPHIVFFIFSILEGIVMGTVTGSIAQTTFGDTNGLTLVGQAIMGTVIIFAVCLFLYAQNIIRFAEHSKARKVLYAVIAGFGLFYLVNLVISLVFGTNLLWGGGIFAIIIGIVALVVASLSIIDDFGMVDRHVENGANDKEKWILSLSLLSGILWVYIELLRLLVNLSQRN